MKNSTHSVAILIPMFNEKAVAKKCVDTVIPIIKRLSTLTQLIVVNDGSRDKTSGILKKLEEKYGKSLLILTHKKNKGYGAALQTGISYAISHGFEWILHMDSDLTNDPKYIPQFTKFVNRNVDCVKASRYINNAHVVNVPYHRRFVSITGNLVSRAVFRIGIKDCTNGFRMTRLRLLKDVTFKENNFSIIMEELYYLKKVKARFAEIPYTLTARTNSISHFSYKPKVFFDYFKYVVKSAFV